LRTIVTTLTTGTITTAIGTTTTRTTTTVLSQLGIRDGRN